MSKYIGSTPVVTQVDGYNRTEADSTFVDVTGDTVTGSLIVDQDLTVDTNTLYVDSANNRVGIGTSSPNYNLHLDGDTSVSLQLTNSTTGSTTGDGLVVSCDATASRIINREANALTFSTNNSERMRIDSSGNVGIGTSSLDEPLVVAGDIKARGSSFLHFTNTSDAVGIGSPASSILRLQSNLTSGRMEFQTNGSEAMRIDSSGNVGIGTSSPVINAAGGKGIHISNSGAAASLHVERTDGADFEIISGASGAVLGTRDTTPVQIKTNNSEAMRIDSSGNLLVGTTNISTNSGTQLYSNGTIYTHLPGTNSTQHVRFYRDSSVVGSIATTGTSTSYNTSSDERLKENIADVQPASDLIDGIQVRQFNWKVDGEHQRYGMIAQELEAVAPEAVTKGETEDDMWAVDYSKLVPMLVKEIQDLRKRVNELENTQ